MAKRKDAECTPQSTLLYSYASIENKKQHGIIKNSLILEILMYVS